MSVNGTNGSTLKHITKCRLCPQIFQASPMDVPIVGEPPAARIQKFVMALMAHLQKKHGEHMALISQGGGEFMGLLALRSFETADPNIQQTIELARARFFVVTRKNLMPDAMIVEKAVSLGLDPATQQQVVDLMKEMRDVLTEQGKYATFQQQPETSLVAP